MSKVKDLSGMTFGRLTAKEIIRVDKRKGAIWRCECSCGGEKEVPASRLINKKTQSCGCLVREAKERGNITGQRFGKLVAIRFDHVDEKYKPHWLFQCDCGNQKVLPVASVKWSNVRSCGCLAKAHIAGLNRLDITGERFDRLVAVRPTEERDVGGSVIWECKCDCGNTVMISVNTLRQGRTHSCGCLYDETRQDCAKARRDFTDHTSISALVSTKKRSKKNSSGHTGVYLDKRFDKWCAYINLQKKRYYLGSFACKDDAIKARNDAEERFHDPIIMERWSALTAERQAEFLRYLHQHTGKDFSLELPGGDAEK